MKNRNIFLLLMTASLLRCVDVKEPATVVVPGSLEDASADSSDSSDSGTAESDVSSSVSVLDGGDASDLSAKPADDAGDSSDEPEPCNHCSSEGSLRCGDDMIHLQVCDKRKGCLGWHDAPPCSSDQLCCKSSCVPVDAKNCFACGAICDGDTPVCDKALKVCVCNDAVCGATGKVCDATTHQCALDPTRTDVYVDPTAGRDEDGSKAHPYRTITAALQAPRAPGIVLHVHLAKGYYDKEHGETLPLVLRGVSLEGLGPIDSVIKGSGTYDARVPKGAINAEVSATIVIGDSALKSSISNVRLYDTVPPGTPAHHAVFCDRGNAPRPAVSPPIPANTVVDRVSIGTGYDIGIIATTSTVPTATGCNLQVTSSSLDVAETGAGLWAIGCDHPTLPDTVRLPVVVRLGDGTEKGGNFFRGFPIERGLGVLVSGCVTNFIASYNELTRLSSGIDIRQPTHANEVNGFSITHNNLHDMRKIGLKLAGGAIVVYNLSDNQISAIYTYPQDLPGESIGLLVEGLNENGFAFIANATNNQFISDQSGVVFRSQFPVSALSDPSNFNGGNAFHCNAGTERGDPFNIIGGDVIITAAFPPARGAFNFDDNEWDHAPPTFSSTLAVDGTDLTVSPTTLFTAKNPTKVALQYCERP